MRYATQLRALFMFVVLMGGFSLGGQILLASPPVEDGTNGESSSSHGEVDLQVVNNYIFWCAYFYDQAKVMESYINGVGGMSDHGYTYKLKAGGTISVYTEYGTTANPRKDFLDTVRGCEKISGHGLFRSLYVCSDKITGGIATASSTYIVTYYKDPSRKDWRWDWGAFKLILETFRLIDGSEFNALYRVLYPEVANLYEKNGPHGKIARW